MMYYAGIDIGSTTTKCVLMNEEKKLAGKTIISTGVDINKACLDILSTTLKSINIERDQIRTIVTTGYGRYIPPYSQIILPEMQAIAKGIQWFCNGEKLVSELILDIGGHDTKVLIVNEKGELEKFAANEKCAAGTGKFVENIAEIYGFTLEQMAELAFNETGRCKLESQCGIFIESEINKLLSAGEKVENVFAGLFQNMIHRVMIIIHKLGYSGSKLYFTGGFSRNPYAVFFLKNFFKQIIVPADSQFTCAIGGAIHAYSLSQSPQGNVDEKRS
ncbi:MAG: acyl-CoA dehydratase activase [Candidatus Omnitrophota bacterium]